LEPSFHEQKFLSSATIYRKERVADIELATVKVQVAFDKNKVLQVAEPHDPGSRISFWQFNSWFAG